MSYWPWWAGAIGLATITVGYAVALGRTIGLSGAWERVLNWKLEREVERQDEALANFDFDAAFLAQTEAAFGSAQGVDGGDEAGATATVADTDTGEAIAIPARPKVSTQAVLLVSVFLGGFIAAIVSGRFELRSDMGEDFSMIVADGWLMWPALLIGGIMVGVGTRLAGGCSSGHGLSGCGRLQPPSMAATAVFFGTAVAVSTLLWRMA